MRKSGNWNGHHVRNPAPIQVKFWEWTTLMGPYQYGKRWNSREKSRNVVLNAKRRLKIVPVNREKNGSPLTRGSLSLLPCNQGKSGVWGSPKKLQKKCFTRLDESNFSKKYRSKLEIFLVTHHRYLLRYHHRYHDQVFSWVVSLLAFCPVACNINDSNFRITVW